MKKPTRSSIRNKLDIIFSQIIRSKGRCERCGKTEGLQAAHIFSRSNLAVRWDLENAFCLDSGCHVYWAHKNPIEFTEWTKVMLGEEKYQKLRRKASTIKKWSIPELEDLLTNLQMLYGRYL